MALDKGRIVELLGCGLRNEIVASTVGCDPAYITQLMADPVISEQVVALRTAALTANTKRDSQIDKIEDDLIEQVREMVETRMFYKPHDALRALQVINAAKRRGVPAHESLTINQTIVNLQIPKEVVRTFTVNTQGEVVDVEGQTLVTMPAHSLLRELQQKRAGGQNGIYEKVARHLPAAILQRDSEANEDA